MLFHWVSAGSRCTLNIYERAPSLCLIDGFSLPSSSPGRCQGTGPGGGQQVLQKLGVLQIVVHWVFGFVTVAVAVTVFLAGAKGASSCADKWGWRQAQINQNQLSTACLAHPPSSPLAVGSHHSPLTHKPHLPASPLACKWFSPNMSNSAEALPACCCNTWCTAVRLLHLQQLAATGSCLGCQYLHACLKNWMQ